MTPKRDDLTVVEQRIRAAKEYIYQQERLIEGWRTRRITPAMPSPCSILNRALRTCSCQSLLKPKTL